MSPGAAYLVNTSASRARASAQLIGVVHTGGCSHRAQAAFAEAVDPACDEHHFRIAADHPSLPGHFPGRPIVPGVLILDHVTASVHARTGRHVAGFPRVKFASPLLPEEAACVQFAPRAGGLSFRVSALRGGVPQAIAEGTLVLAPLPEALP